MKRYSLKQILADQKYGHQYYLLNRWKTNLNCVRKTNDGKNWRAVWIHKSKQYSRVFGPTLEDKKEAIKYSNMMKNHQDKWIGRKKRSPRRKRLNKINLGRLGRRIKLGPRYDK
jgi:hypothetical protein